jgi:hypothetical protein
MATLPPRHTNFRGDRRRAESQGQAWRLEMSVSSGHLGSEPTSPAASESSSHVATRVGLVGGRGGAKPASDQPDAESHLEQSTRNGRNEAGARDVEQLSRLPPASTRSR